MRSPCGGRIAVVTPDAQMFLRARHDYSDNDCDPSRAAGRLDFANASMNFEIRTDTHTFCGLAHTSIWGGAFLAPPASCLSFSSEN